MIIAIPGPIANNDADGRISQTGHYCGRADASFRHLRRHYLQQHAERWGAVRSLAKHKFCGHGPNQSIGQRFLEIHGAAESEGSGTPAAGVERIACAGYLSWPQEGEIGHRALRVVGDNMFGAMWQEHDIALVQPLWFRPLDKHPTAAFGDEMEANSLLELQADAPRPRYLCPAVTRFRWPEITQELSKKMDDRIGRIGLSSIHLGRSIIVRPAFHNRLFSAASRFVATWQH